MRYHVSSPPAIQQLTEAAVANSEIISAKLGSKITRIERLIDIEMLIASHFVWMFDTGFAPRIEAERTTFWLFHKNISAAFDALSLLRRGAFGSARIILRQILESLIIAKYCALSEDESLALKWQAGRIIYLSKEVFQRITDPDTASLYELWGLMSNYTHASIFAQQRTPIIDDEIEWDELNVTFVYLEILLECNYHLLNSYIITSSMAYYASNYRSSYAVPELRAEAHNLFREARRNFGPGARKLLTTYKRRWKLKPPISGSIVRTNPTIRRPLSLWT
ncbi:MAG TPA: hypothetical protein VFR81_28740, partial [Longimicrobium sp.]|nr:hypothetical protein [Longimicrobium sp.]